MAPAIKNLINLLLTIEEIIEIELSFFLENKFVKHVSQETIDIGLNFS